MGAIMNLKQRLPMRGVLCLLTIHFFVVESTRRTYRLTAADARLALVGRFHRQGTTAKFDWPCTSIALHYAAWDNVTVEMDGGGSRFAVIGCGPDRTEFSTSYGVANYTVCRSSPVAGQLEVLKLTEAGPMWGPIVKVLMPQRVPELHAIYITSAEQPT